MKPLSGRVAIITGASQGLGLAIARRYLDAGVEGLALCARDGALLSKAVGELAAPSQTKVVHESVDVSNSGAVERFVAGAARAFGRIDILVNNAGIYGPKGAIDEVDWDDWTRALQINLNGSVQMCRAVLPHFRKLKRGKIVQLSGGGATHPLPRLSAYAVSKAAIVRFAETLAEEVREDNIQVNAIAPGALNTRLLDEVLEAGPERVGKAFYEKARKQQKSGGASMELAADLAVFLAPAKSDAITGKLLSAPWDPWQTLETRAEELAGSDIYTLRRIVPADRGKDWGDAK